MQETIIKQDAEYCLNCKNKPCKTGCPLSNDTALFISFAKNSEFHKAYDVLSKTTIMPAICGRICPHSKQCQGHCIRGIKSDPVKIGEIEAYIGDLALENDWNICDQSKKIVTDKSVGIVGGGPAGLTCAAILASYGVKVTIYEKHNYLGGLLMHGIPDFRLDKSIVKKTTDRILNLGVKAKLNQELGQNLSISDLEKNHDAIFLSFGANISGKLNISGEELDGVVGGNEFLENKPNLDLFQKTAIVNGGGNVAIDVARTLIRKGCKSVTIVYRRSEKEMPAEPDEIERAKNDGVKFLFQHNIVKILGEQNVKQVELIRTELVKTDSETRPTPVDIKNSNYLLDADFVFMAVGGKIEENLAKNLGVELDAKNKIVVNEVFQTSNPKIFAGGDLLSNRKSGSVAFASSHGRDAGVNILKFLKIL